MILDASRISVLLAITLTIGACSSIVSAQSGTLPNRTENLHAVPVRESVTDRTARHESVLALSPVGYWPADDAHGSILMDKSGNDMHGRTYNLPWQDGLLDFTSGFHWAEVSVRPEFLSDTFSIGGWFYTRRDDYIGGTDLQGPEANESGPHHTQGVSLLNNAYGQRGGWVRWDGPMQTRTDGLGIRLRSPGKGRYDTGTLLDVVHGNRGDVIGTAASGRFLQPNRWHHVLYVYWKGTAGLYIDGELVQMRENVPYTPSNRPFVVGNDMTWWMLYPIGSQSLSGSVRDIVYFDRALTVEEAARLASSTVPAISPDPLESPSVSVEYLPVAPDGFDALPLHLQQATLRRLDEEGMLLPEWLPVLKQAIATPATRPSSARLLARYPGEHVGTYTASELLPAMESILADTTREDFDRATAALALAAFGDRAASAAPGMRMALEEIEATRQAAPPKIEELLRNSLLHALVAVDGDNPATRQLVGTAVGDPLLDLLDGDAEWLAPVRQARTSEGPFAALAVLRDLPLVEHGEVYFSEGDIHRDRRDGTTPNQRAYAPVAESDGVTYRVGSGIPWESAERVTKEQYLEAVDELPEEYQQAARQWEYVDSPHLYRLRVHKIDADGNEESALLEGPWFLFEGSDAKLRGWTIDIDSAGHLHLLGGMHNAPIPRYYAPGVWEKMGLAREGEAAPTTMYWVSKRPGDITEWDFVGHPDNPRNLPSGGMNYMNFVRDRDNHMFLYGRITTQAIQSWGMFQYNPGSQRWQVIGGDARSIVTDARSKDPGLFIERGGRQWQPSPPQPSETAFAWAWQPHFYNFIRGWGAKVDKAGRLHVRMPLHALGHDNRIVDHIMTAWSDDLGQTWHRPDGTPVALPLTLNPSDKHNADINLHHGRMYWQAWLEVLGLAGYEIEEVNLEGF